VDITLEKIKQEKIKKEKEKEEVAVEAPTKISYYTSGQALWCCDVEKNTLRGATKKDLADFSRVVNTFPG